MISHSTELDITKASRAFDRWIGRNIMGWPSHASSPEFTANLAAAFQLVDAMHKRGHWAQMRSPFGTGENDDGWWCGFTPHLTSGWNGTPDHWTSAPTLPLAICQAAYKALTEQGG